MAERGTRPKVLIVMHQAHSTPGRIGVLLRALGADLDMRRPSLDEPLPETLAEHDGVVVFGGPMSANDDCDWIGREIAWLETPLRETKPLLGICLGAQLFARALGSRVYPGAAKEIGWAPVGLTAAGAAGVTRHLAGPPLLHWHGDTFDLPKGAELLASTAICHNQAFTHGKNVIAFQFHPEADGGNFERWLIGHAAEIAGVPGLSVNALRDDTRRFAPESAPRGEKCLAEWLRALT